MVVNKLKKKTKGHLKTEHQWKDALMELMAEDQGIWNMQRGH